ncbi:MAG: hypothetical protein LBJ93_01030 [Clostridiales bacterium]|nr:hypothetical protein [Clostridiales bacterium]
MYYDPRNNFDNGCDALTRAKILNSNEEHLSCVRGSYYIYFTRDFRF